MKRLLVAIAVLAVLGSCAVAPTRAPVQEAVVEAPVAKVSRLELLAEVRAAARDAGDVIQVEPLRDPIVDDLIAKARAAEAAGDVGAAAERLRQALDYTPEDPALIQEYAELLLAIDRLDDAEQLASRSFESGPRLGGLCRRNWMTVRLAREHRGDVDGAAEAAEQLGRCIVEPQLRL